LRALSTIAAVWLFLWAPAPALPQPRAGYVIVVNPANPETSVDRQFLEGAFLKKITRWPNDDTIRPAELVESAPARQRFSEEILERSVEAVKGYWQQRIFSGRDVPPPEFATSQEVIEYVLKYPGAIGCVASDSNTDGTKVLAIR
jgi:hypothetical protein